MGVIYALFVCAMVNGQPTNCAPAVTETFATLQQCEQVRAILHPQEAGTVRFFCMQRPEPTWTPAD